MKLIISSAFRCQGRLPTLESLFHSNPFRPNGSRKKKVGAPANVSKNAVNVVGKRSMPVVHFGKGCGCLRQGVEFGIEICNVDATEIVAVEFLSDLGYDERGAVFSDRSIIVVALACESVHHENGPVVLAKDAGKLRNVAGQGFVLTL